MQILQYPSPQYNIRSIIVVQCHATQYFSTKHPIPNHNTYFVWDEYEPVCVCVWVSGTLRRAAILLLFNFGIFRNEHLYIYRSFSHCIIIRLDIHHYYYSVIVLIVSLANLGVTWNACSMDSLRPHIYTVHYTHTHTHSIAQTKVWCALCAHIQPKPQCVIECVLVRRLIFFSLWLPEYIAIDCFQKLNIWREKNIYIYSRIGENEYRLCIYQAGDMKWNLTH